MGEYIETGRATDYPEGTASKVQARGHEILLAHVGENFYAVSNRCPHLGGDLSAGTLEGTVVTCPRHKSQFDIRDGSVVRWLKGTGVLSTVGKALKSPESLHTYNVKVEDGKVMVEV